MKKDHNRQLAHELLIFLGILMLIFFILRLWPILLLALVAILVYALRMLFLTCKAPPTVVPEDPTPPASAEPPDTELAIQQRAFALLQRRITESVSREYPSARWVWAESNAFEKFISNIPLILLLNNAGGYRKATVRTHELMFCDLTYETVASDAETTPDADDDTSPEDESLPDTPAEPVNYELLAFEWVEKNILNLNIHCNEAIAEGKETFLICAELLPIVDSWPDISDELLRNGFAEAEVLEDGIQVNLPH